MVSAVQKAVIKKTVKKTKDRGTITSYDKEFVDVPQTQEQINNRTVAVNKVRARQGLSLVTPEEIQQSQDRNLPIDTLRKLQNTQSSGTIPTSTTPTSTTPTQPVVPGQPLTPQQTQQVQQKANIPTFQNLQTQTPDLFTNPIEEVTGLFKATGEATNIPEELQGTAEGFKLGIAQRTQFALKEQAKLSLRQGFMWADELRSLTTIGGRDTVDVLSAKQIYSDSKTNLAQIIQDVQSGKTQPHEAISVMQSMISANNVLHQRAKAEGFKNLSYWIKGGKELEILAYNNDDELNRMYGQLLNAIAINEQSQQQLNTQAQLAQDILR